MRKGMCLALCISMFFIFTSCQKEESVSNMIDLGQLSNIEVEYETVQVKKEDLLERIEQRNIYVFPGIQWNIKFKEDVILKKCYFKHRALINKGDLIAEIDTQKIDEEIKFKEFEIEMEKARLSDMIVTDIGKEELKIKEIDIEIMEEELRKIEREKVKYKIFAPSRCYISNGSMVNGRKVLADETVFILSDLTKFEIKTNSRVDLKKYKNVSVGNKVGFFDGYGEFEGKVSFISFDERNFGEIFFQVDEKVTFDKSMTNGLSLSAGFGGVRVTDVLTVPRGAIKFNQKYYVEVLKDGIRRMRFVKLGAVGVDEENMSVVQVVSGLSEGETVIMKVKNEGKEEI